MSKPTVEEMARELAKEQSGLFCPKSCWPHGCPWNITTVDSCCQCIKSNSVLGEIESNFYALSRQPSAPR